MKESKFPAIETVEAELKREKYKKLYKNLLKSTFFTLIVGASAAVIVIAFWLPVLKIYGASMTPSLEEGEIVISARVRDVRTGDLVAFWYSNRVLIKRVIATSGEWIEIKEDGTVYIDGNELDEPYISEKAFGNCDLEFPYQVPENRIFVMGDHRSVSLDSRNSAVGCIPKEEIVGSIVYRIWPIDKIGSLN